MTHWARPAAPVLPTGRSKQASCRAASSGTDHASASALSYRGTYENGLSAVRVRGVVRCSVYVLTLFRVRQVDAFSFQAECCDRSVRIGAQNALGGTDETHCAGRKPRCFCIVWCKRPDRRSTGQGCNRYIERSQLRDGLQSAAVQSAEADQQGHRQEPRSGVELQLRRRSKRGIAAAGLPGRASTSRPTTPRWRSTPRPASRSGRPRSNIPPETPRIVCCGIINRGAALFDGKVFRTTLDANVIALDAKTGKELWRQKAADIKEGYSMTVAPLVADGVVHHRHLRRRVRHPRLHRRLGSRRPASISGAPTRFRARTSPAATPGRATPGSSAAARPGSPARTIPS